MKDRVDRMRSVRIEDGFGTKAWVHGIHLVDEGSCELPEGHTITLEEWKAQQAA